MKFTYRINTFCDEGGEQMTAIFCEELQELAVETRGDILCTEQDALEDVLEDTPWDGAGDLSFVADWRGMTSGEFNALNSAGLRDWINTKEDPDDWKHARARELAGKIYASGEWSFSALTEFCDLAGMAEEWHDADGERFESVVYEAARRLHVEI